LVWTKTSLEATQSDEIAAAGPNLPVSLYWRDGAGVKLAGKIIQSDGERGSRIIAPLLPGILQPSLPFREEPSRYRQRLERPQLMGDVGYLLDVIGRDSQLMLDFVLFTLELRMLEPFGICKVS